MNKVKRHTHLGIFVSICMALLLFATFTHAQEDEDTVLVDGMEVDLVDESSLPPAGAENWYKKEGIPGGDRVFGDFVVGPGKVELEVAPGESKTIMMSITNRTGERRKFEISTEDMTGSREPDKGVVLLGGAEGPYSLRDYVQIGGDTVELEHNERARVPVTISVPANADPGGRYGSVLVRTLAVEGDSGIEDNLVPQSPIIARIGTLFFVTVPGEVERSGELLDFSVIPEKAWYESGPFTFSILFENTGSIHLAPYGTLSINNTFGQEVGYVELDPWFVMPLSLRTREIEWDAERLLGRYTANLTVYSGFGEESSQESVVLWILPWKMVAGTFAVVFLIVFFIRSLFKNFEFRRKG